MNIYFHLVEKFIGNFDGVRKFFKVKNLMGEPPRQRQEDDSKAERESEDQPTRERLVKSLRKLAEDINKVVNETREEYCGGTQIEKFVDVPSAMGGVRNLWSHVANYIECLRVNCVSKYSDLEELWKCHYGREEVRDTVEDVLQAEEEHKDLLQEIERDFVEKQDSGASLKTLKVGDCISEGLRVTDARSKKECDIETYWKKSNTTLFVMLRHFG